MRQEEIAVKRECFARYMRVMSGISGKIVCVDIDNTIANTNEELARMGYNTNRYPAKEINGEFWFSRDGLAALVKAKPIRETLSIIKLMEKMKAEVVFATARHIALAHTTENWLAQYQLSKPVFYVHNKLLVEADVYIEDSPAEIEGLIKVGKTVLVPEWPYNAGIRHKNIIHYWISGR